MANGLLSENPLNDPNYDYATILPFRMRNTLDVDELDTDVMPELAVPGLLRDVGNSAVRMGQMARGQRAPGLLIGDVMDFSPAGLLNRMPAGALGMNAFHGTPNRFAPEPGFPQGRPRLDMMGTGEGAQAYGPGFYSAEQRAVADQYRRNLSSGVPQLILTTQTGVKRGTDLDFTDLQVAKYLETGERDAGQFKHNTVYYAKKRAERDNQDEVLKRLEEYGPDVRADYQSGLGTLYKLDIPDADAAKLLDYDAPISAQPKVVQDAITKLGFMPDTPDKLAGGDVWFRMRRQLGEQEAADAMRKAGVPGLRYRDEKSRYNRVTVNGTPVRAFRLNEDGYDDPQVVYDLNNLLQKLGQGYTVKQVEEIAAKYPKLLEEFQKFDIQETGTRNFVVWDQDVLDRTKILQRDDETFEAAPGVPAMGLLNSNNNSRPGGLDFYGMYSGGVI